MPTLDRLAREQCEKAFTNYINTHKAGTALAIPAEVEVRARKGQLKDDGTFVLQNVDEIPLPCVAVSCPRVKPHESVGYPICELHILALTAVDEENAADRAAARFGYLAELFSDDKLATLMAAMNQPPTPVPFQFGLPDTMTVAGNPLVWDETHTMWAPAGIDWDNIPGFTGYLVNVGQGAADPPAHLVAYANSLVIHHYTDGEQDAASEYAITNGELVQDPEGPQITDFETDFGFDSRVIKNFNLFGFALVEDMGQETDRHWIDHLVFEVHCNPTDDTNGDGAV